MSFVRPCPALGKLCPSAAVNLRVKSRKCRSLYPPFILMPAFRLDWIFMEIRALLLGIAKLFPRTCPHCGPTTTQPTTTSELYLKMERSISERPLLSTPTTPRPTTILPAYTLMCSLSIDELNSLRSLPSTRFPMDAHLCDLNADPLTRQIRSILIEKFRNTVPTLSTVDASLDNIALDFRSRESTPHSSPACQTIFLRPKDSTGVLLGSAETPSRSSLGGEFLALNLEKVDSYSH
ncbi:hypothetical protein CDAR_544671 [Caerostris darwini]|uniref:Uncharacterized protein n=1 Tax=Caerostris darwini TaxID=1538125 RepID=A0AAV4TT47_9ARAC|nr:hypothetical protein CDAR_544671 [Caerostris darwini]